jgi:hypothetical protein
MFYEGDNKTLQLIPMEILCSYYAMGCVKISYNL